MGDISLTYGGWTQLDGLGFSYLVDACMMVKASG